MTDIAEIWVWTVELVPERNASMRDISGYEVSARDGSIGKVDEVVNGPDGRSYIVVDTGFWIFEKKRMIPAGAIDTIDHQNRRINVRLTKDEIRHAPDYDAQRRDEPGVQKAHENYYGQRAATGR
jgi:hypothetical protein